MVVFFFFFSIETHKLVELVWQKFVPLKLVLHNLLQGPTHRCSFTAIEKHRDLWDGINLCVFSRNVALHQTRKSLVKPWVRENIHPIETAPSSFCPPCSSVGLLFPDAGQNSRCCFKSTCRVCRDQRSGAQIDESPSWIENDSPPPP